MNSMCPGLFKQPRRAMLASLFKTKGMYSTMALSYVGRFGTYIKKNHKITMSIDRILTEPKWLEKNWGTKLP